MVQPAKKRGSSKSPEATSETNLVAVSGAPDDVKVLTVDETEANKVHMELLDLRRKHEDLNFEIARCLYDISHRRLFMLIGPGYKSFKDYVEGELLFKERKAKYLAQVEWWFGEVHGSHPEMYERVKKLGWSKAKELVKVMDPDNCEEWLAIAENGTVTELRDARRAALKAAGKSARVTMPEGLEVADVSEAPALPEGKTDEATEPEEGNGGIDVNKGVDGMVEQVLDGVDDGDGDGEEDVTPKTKKTMNLTPNRKSGDGSDGKGVSPPTLDEMKTEVEENKKWKRRTFDIPPEWDDVVAEALKCAEESTEGRSTHPGNLLALICLHFCGGYSKHPSIMNGEWLATFEANTGLTLVAVDEAKGAIVYGQDNAERLSGGEENTEE